MHFTCSELNLKSNNSILLKNKVYNIIVFLCIKSVIKTFII